MLFCILYTAVQNSAKPTLNTFTLHPKSYFFLVFLETKRSSKINPAWEQQTFKLVTESILAGRKVYYETMQDSEMAGSNTIKDRTKILQYFMMSPITVTL